MKKVFLDYNSTTPVHEEVLETMLPYFSEHFGNAASQTHSFGWTAAEAVKKARRQVADSIGADISEIIFTSGSTESINLALKSVVENYSVRGRHMIAVATEHKAVLDVCAYLKKQGMEITLLPVLMDGTIDLDVLKNSLRNDTILVCAMMANNETGVLLPVDAVAELAHQAGALFFTDATQAMGKIQVNVDECKADLLCLSSHKIYGPKGAGILYKRRRNPRVYLTAQIHGGGHENSLRSGTLNVPAIVGMGKACELAVTNRWEYAAHTSALRSKLEQELCTLHRAYVNGNSRHRLPNTTNICFEDARPNELIKSLHSIAVSSGSACSSELPEASHVLSAMGLSEDNSFRSIRFSLGLYTTTDDIELCIQEISKVLEKQSL